MVGVLVAVLLAALAYLVLAGITGSALLGLIAAVLVLLAGIPSGGYGFGRRT